MKSMKILTAGIELPQRLRHLDPDKVNELAASMKTLGLQHPITVWTPDNKHVFLTAGAHRLAAAHQLGWEYIECTVVELEGLERQLWEIDENLARSELTAAETDAHLRKRKEIWEEMRSRESGTASPTLTGRGNKGFAAETANMTGRSKRDINRALARNARIAPDVLKDIAGTLLDTPRNLTALSKHTHERQREIVAEVKASRRASAVGDAPGKPARPVEITATEVRLAVKAAQDKARITEEKVKDVLRSSFNANSTIDLQPHERPLFLSQLWSAIAINFAAPAGAVQKPSDDISSWKKRLLSAMGRNNPQTT